MELDSAVVIASPRGNTAKIIQWFLKGHVIIHSRKAWVGLALLTDTGDEALFLHVALMM
jgi:hypothetical protein